MAMTTTDYPVDEIRHTAEVSLPNKQVNNLAKKLRKGFKIPPVWLDAEGTLIDGNHRLHAAMEAELPTIPAIVLTDEQDDKYEEMIGVDRCHPLDAYSAVTGLDSPRNFWIR
jgi:hypothetical protein